MNASVRENTNFGVLLCLCYAIFDTYNIMRNLEVLWRISNGVETKPMSKQKPSTSPEHHNKS